MKKRLLTMLVLLMTVATGAWAQTETLLTTITPTGDASYDETTPGVVTVTLSNENGWFSEVHGWCWFSSGSLTVEAKEGYTITRCVFKQTDKTPVTITTSPFALTFREEVGTCEQSDEFMDGVTSIEVYGNAAAPATTYSVTLAEGTEDGDNWTISPTEAAEGSSVTATYEGKKKVKSVKAVKVANLWDGDLSKLTAESTPEYATATDGMTITGTLAANVKVSIADGATVTLDNVVILGEHTGDLDNMWAGLTCLGDATIILKDGTVNTVRGFHDHFPGIYIPGDRQHPENNKTLIIKGGELGSGRLVASNNGQAAAIGGVKSDADLNHLALSAGNIEIQGGDIEATAGRYSAAIGAAASDTCGYIRITGGKIFAHGGENGVGIGCGAGMNDASCEAHCGDITITGGNITAIGTGGAAIGCSTDGVCGNITISGGIVQAMGNGPFGTPGIGSGCKGSFETGCGNILINGGTVQAYGGSNAPGIGSGGSSDQSGTCGSITITSGVTEVTASKGDNATNSIGPTDSDGKCGTVTIGGTTYWDGNNYQNNGADYLQLNSIQYEPTN